jgi:hypothetical protein
MITPFLALVLAGYAAFVLALGAVWAQQALRERPLARAKRAVRR